MNPNYCPPTTENFATQPVVNVGLYKGSCERLILSLAACPAQSVFIFIVFYMSVFYEQIHDDDDDDDDSYREQPRLSRTIFGVLYQTCLCTYVMYLDLCLRVHVCSTWGILSANSRVTWWRNCWSMMTTQLNPLAVSSTGALSAVGLVQKLLIVETQTVCVVLSIM